MAQERWTKETEETECQTPETLLCANNCGFYGSAATNNLCSKCYKDLSVKQQPPLKPFPFVPVSEKMPSASSSVRLEPLVEAPKVEESNSLKVEETSSSEEVGKQRQSNRCMSCRRKVGLTGFRCRCGDIFCSVHRYSEKHDCSFDYRSVGRDAIARENPVVKARKIEKI